MSNNEATARPIMGATAYRHPDRIEQDAGPRGELSAEVKDTPASVTPEADATGKPVDWEKRYRDMQSYQMKQENSFKKEKARLESNTAPEFVVPKTQEELDAWSGENPELYAVVQSIAHGISKQQMKGVNGQVDQIRGELEDASRDNAVHQLQAAHPDFAQIDESPQFKTWLDSQPADIQSWVLDNNADAGLLIRALSIFKYDTGWGKEASSPQNNQNVNANQERVQATPDMDVTVQGSDGDESVDPREHPKYIWSEQEIQKMRGAEYAHYFNAITLAHEEGRVAP